MYETAKGYKKRLVIMHGCHYNYLDRQHFQSLCNLTAITVPWRIPQILVFALQLVKCYFQLSRLPDNSEHKTEQNCQNAKKMLDHKFVGRRSSVFSL